MPITRSAHRAVSPRVCSLLLALAPGAISAAEPSDCRPAAGTPAQEVIRVCGGPHKRYEARQPVTESVHREWDYGATIVGLIDELVVYVLNMKD